MCVDVAFRGTTEADLIAYKGVYLEHKYAKYTSPVELEYRAGQIDADVGDIVEYVPGEKMTDEKGVGYFLYTSLEDALKCFKESYYAVLKVKIPAGTEIIAGRDVYDKFTIIARTIEVLYRVERW